ncbi:MAG: hypothetical protein ACFFDN_06875 [Candidatus Hodarchaeota archaeon]
MKWIIYLKTPKAKKFQQLKYPSNILTNPIIDIALSNGLILAKNYSSLGCHYDKIRAIRKGLKLKKKGLIIKIKNYAGEEEYL